jgi:hypothetical protein
MAVEPEVLDPVMPGLQVMADEGAPAVVAPWATYVKTRRYAAVVQRLKGLTRAAKTAAPGRTPIGFLPGDDVTPQDERMAMLAPGEGCESGCSVCAPAFEGGPYRNQRYKTGALVDPNGNNLLLWFQEAVGAWNSAGMGRLDLLTDLFTGNVEVELAEQGVGQLFGYGDSTRVIFYPRLFQQAPGFVQYVMKHEIGHTIGLGHVPTGGGFNQQQLDQCTCYSTIMWLWNNCHADGPTAADSCAVRR